MDLIELVRKFHELDGVTQHVSGHQLKESARTTWPIGKLTYHVAEKKLTSASGWEMPFDLSEAFALYQEAFIRAADTIDSAFEGIREQVAEVEGLAAEAGVGK